MSIFDDLIIYIILLFTFIIGLVVFYILSITWTEKSIWFKAKLKMLRKNLIWNIAIRVLSVTYIKCLMSVGTQFRLAIEENEFQENSEKLIALTLGAFLLAIPLVAWITL